MKEQVEGTASARWAPEALKELNQRFEGRPPQEILRWGWETFSPHIALATNFGLQSIVLMHLIAQSYPETTIFYLDTDLLFSEAYTLRDELSAWLGLRFTCVRTSLSLVDQAAKYGPALWSQDPDLCCHLRKVEPLHGFLATQHAWITGIRHDQTESRANAGLVEWDRAYGLVKLNPLANWPIEQVWAYIHAHSLPFNRLHLRGYPSIGCWPCTQPVAPGEHPRAGRWPGWSKSECGIHSQPAEKEGGSDQKEQ